MQRLRTPIVSPFQQKHWCHPLSTQPFSLRSSTQYSKATTKNRRYVKIVEVGPRDGLQNESKILPTSTKVQFIQQLIKANCPVIEVGSFVSPSRVPAMANSKEVVQALQKQQHGTTGAVFSALTPNVYGLRDALEAGVEEVAIFGAASETFSHKNIQCSIQESLDRFSKVTELAKVEQVPVRGYISCVLGCPYEGEIAPEKVATIAEQLVELGCYEISLGDTIGVGTPEKAIQLITQVKSAIGVDKIAVHFHDTYGQALTNIYAALGEGVNVVDSSVAGLGGCPYAVGASGNVATEDVVYMLHGMEIETGIDLNKLMDAGFFICDQLERMTGSKCALAMSRKRC